MPSRELTPARKAVYALGDLTVNTALSSLGLIYASYFLTQVAGLRPALAGLVPLVGRLVDAVTDPAMGRISDLTRWQSGRRRPYFLIGAIPFGVSFALLWQDPPLVTQAARFAYYAAAYCLLSVAMTVLSVPYLALLPEMALGYDARTSLNTFRAVGALTGVFAAVSVRPLADSLGGGPAGFAGAGCVYGVFLALPWLAVHAVSFERPGFTRPTHGTLLQGFRELMRHESFRRLVALFLTGRIAIDLISTLLILYFTFWLGRSEDFEPAMFLFLITVILALPVWLRLARGRDKAAIFMVGAAWWMTTSLSFLFFQPEWPRWVLLVLPPVVALGYAAVDLMPWAMLGEVVDEDDLRSGQRREGLYSGVFTFLRKLAGAVAVFLVLGILDLAGFRQGAEQTETAREAIRFMSALAPAFFLALSLWFARGYPLTRAAHAGILRRLEESRESAPRAEDRPPAP
jgi:sugar (glycoside-pentoside-hexuronide) transporter